MILVETTTDATGQQLQLHDEHCFAGGLIFLHFHSKERFDPDTFCTKTLCRYTGMQSYRHSARAQQEQASVQEDSHVKICKRNTDKSRQNWAPTTKSKRLNRDVKYSCTPKPYNLASISSVKRTTNNTLLVSRHKRSKYYNQIKNILTNNTRTNQGDHPSSLVDHDVLQPDKLY